MEKSKLEAMEKEFKEKGLDYNRFLVTDESVRKRILKDDYGETKTKYGWQYDQPIVAAEEATTTVAIAEEDKKEQAALDKKAEKLAEKESEESSRYKKRY